MFVGRNFWKSLLLESEKSKIFFSSSNVVTSLIDLMARCCAFHFRCFLTFWIAWKLSNRLCIWLFSCSRWVSMLAGSSLGNSAERVLGTCNPCHRQYNGRCMHPYKSRFYQCRNRFYQCKRIDSIIVKLKHEKAFKFGV